MIQGPELARGRPRKTGEKGRVPFDDLREGSGPLRRRVWYGSKPQTRFRRALLRVLRDLEKEDRLAYPTE